MSTVSKCCSPWVPASIPGKVVSGILLPAAVVLLVVGILASYSRVALLPSGAQAMMGVGGTIIGWYVLQVLCFRCREPDGYCRRDSVVRAPKDFDVATEVLKNFVLKVP